MWITKRTEDRIDFKAESGDGFSFLPGNVTDGIADFAKPHVIAQDRSPFRGEICDPISLMWVKVDFLDPINTEGEGNHAAHFGPLEAN